MGVDSQPNLVDHGDQRADWLEPTVISLDAGDAEEDGNGGSDSAFGLS